MPLSERYACYCGIYSRVFVDYINMHGALSYGQLSLDQQGELSLMDAVLRFFYGIPLGYEGDENESSHETVAP